MRICAFSHCSNSTYTLERWKGSICKLHKCAHHMPECSCDPPFRLITFPTQSKDIKARLAWAKIVNRQNPKTGKNWLPGTEDRICAKHFVDGKPTSNNPMPTVDIGNVSIPKPRKPPTIRESAPRVTKTRSECSDVITSTGEQIEDETKTKGALDHNSYCVKCTCKDECSCTGCLIKEKTIRSLQHDFDELKDKHPVKEKRTRHQYRTSPELTERFLSTSKKVKTYTGLQSRQVFEDLLKLVSEKASKMKYWGGTKRTGKRTRNFKKTPTKFGPKRMTTIRVELLIVLMKLRLGIINELLGDLFGISAALVSQIFNTWVKFLAKELKVLIFWPGAETIKRTLPKSLSNYKNLTCTIDCTEIYIDRPRDLELQALTWSDYKKHNTAKLLVGISPNGAISFLSDTWGGRASDQKITKESGFLNLVKRNDLILADRGFAIKEDLMTRGAHLEIPPPSSGQEQMTKSDVNKTKKIANARIHVERAIGRLKHFSILKNILPLTLVPLLDDIVVVCAALCNLLPSLVE